MRRKRWHHVVLGLLATAVLLSAVPLCRASAVIHTFYLPVVNPPNPPWSESINVPQLDPSLAQYLKRIEFDLTGTIQGVIGFENVDSSPNTIVSTLASTFTLQRPDASVIATATPTYSHTELVDAYDGTTDYAGPSGRLLSASANSTSSHTSLPPDTDLTLFTGTGSVTLDVSAAAETWSVTGESGKLDPVSGLTSPQGYATVAVSYIIPEPTAAVLFAAMFCLPLLRRPARSTRP